MSTPKVAIIGRPNVGKSSLFNWLAQRRIAIVDPQAGVTRDRISAFIPTRNGTIELVDTGGLGIVDHQAIAPLVEAQIATAIREATLVLFVVSVQDGTVPLDLKVAAELRRLRKPIVLVANKCDDRSWDRELGAFFELGAGEPLAISTTANRKREPLLVRIAEMLGEREPGGEEPVPEMLLAIVGRQNTGKSTLINTLARAQRVIASEIPGTTRDSVDVRFSIDDKTFVAIDTAGVRRRRAVSGNIEFYSLARARESIRRADVTMLFLDPTAGISKIDKQLAGFVVEEFKPCVLVVNKWDLMLPESTSEYATHLYEHFRTMQFAPCAFITATTGKNVKGLVNLAQSLFKQACQRVPTPKLNEIVHAIVTAHQPPARQGRALRLYYAAQTGVCPPCIHISCNSPSLMDATYQRYFLGQLREQTPFRDIPIQLYLRKHRTTAAD